MTGQTLRSLIVSVSAETSAYQREMARAGRMGQNYLRTITAGNRDATSSWRSQEAAIQAQGVAMQSLTSSVGGYARAMAGALAVGNLIHMADEWGQLSSRLKIATSSQEEFTNAQQGLMEISRTTYKSFSENAELYIRTAGVLKEYGGSAEDALRMTEALSLGLAVSGANAQATASVIDQVSKSLEGGKLQGDGFNAVVTQAPRLLQALQDSLGKSRDELRRMSSDGKLTVDVVSNAWVRQIGIMRAETDGMATSVQDAGVRMRDALMQYIGTVDDGSGATGKLAEMINFASDNIDVLVKVAAAGGIGLLAKRAIDAANGLRLNAIAARDTASAELGRAAAQADTAATSLRLAQADVILAQRQAVLASTAAEAAAASRALSKAKLDEVVATKALEVAQKSQATAASAGRAMASGLMGMLGGPVGLAALATTTAASFWLFRDGANAANAAAVDLKRPISELRAEWEELGNAQRRPILAKLLEEQQAARAKAAEIVKEMQAVAQGPSGDYAGGQRFQANQYQRAAAAGNFRRSIAGGIDIDRATESLSSTIGPNKEVKSTLESLAAQYQENIGKVGVLGDQINSLNGVMSQAELAANGVASGLNKIQGPDQKTLDGWSSYTQTLVERLNAARDGGDPLGELNRRIEREGVDSSTAEGWRILATAIKGTEAAAKASEEAQQKAKKASEDIQRQAERLNDAYKQTLANLTQQVALYGETTELGRLRYDLANGELSKLSDRNKALLQGKAIELDALNARKAYDGLMSSLQSKEQALLATTRERMKVLETANRSGTLNSDQYRAGADAISKATVIEAPEFGGLDASVGGASGEMVKAAQAKAALKKWHEEQLALQKELRDQIKADEASSYEERIAAEQNYLDRVAEINKTNQSRLSDIQGSYKVAVISTFSELSGQAADMVGKIAGEQSGAYKALFIAQKAFAVASIIMNAQIAAAKAPAELTVLGGIPVGAALLAAGYANAAMVGGMALAGFSEGGFTGRGGKFEPKGIVHGGEVVIRKEVVDQPGMKDYLIGLNKSGKPGYSGGGFVGTSGASPSFGSPAVAAGGGAGGAPEIHLHINGDGSGGAVTSTEGYEAMGQALLNTVRQEMPKVARGVIIQEKGQNGLLDPSNRRNG